MLQTGPLNILLLCQSLLVFHGSLLVLFWMIHHVLTGKTPGSLGDTNVLMAIFATVFGGLLLFIEIRLDPPAIEMWLDFTIFQLSISITYVLAKPILRHVYPELFGK